MTESVAGILPYRFTENRLEFFLGKAGGPWFHRKTRSWTIMKGHIEPGETNLERVAEREFFEECGWHVDLDLLHFQSKTQLIQHGRFSIFLAEIPEIESRFCHSNLFELNGSVFPEIESWNWIESTNVLPIIFKSQQEIINEAIKQLTSRS